MLSEIIWCISTVLEILLLVRAADVRLRTRYPVFYTYLLIVLLRSPILFVPYHWYYYTLYPLFYWATEFLTLAMGCLVVFEIYKVALRAYPGTAKMARGVLLLLFAIALAKAGAVFLRDPQLLTDATGLQIERALRTVQAFAIVALVTLFASYSIPFGRNLRGILLGYGLFVGERVICLTFVPAAGKDFWFYAYSGSYVVALTLWLAHLWSYQPVTEAQSAPLEQEYQVIAATTQRRLQETRGYLRRTVRL